MQIIVNGELTDIADGIKMSALIEHLGLTDKRLAVEVNEELVPRSRFDQHTLASNDHIEIIHAVGGG